MDHLNSNLCKSIRINLLIYTCMRLYLFQFEFMQLSSYRLDLGVLLNYRDKSE